MTVIKHNDNENSDMFINSLTDSKLMEVYAVELLARLKDQIIILCPRES